MTTSGRRKPRARALRPKGTDKANLPKGLSGGKSNDTDRREAANEAPPNTSFRGCCDHCGRWGRKGSNGCSRTDTGTLGRPKAVNNILGEETTVKDARKTVKVNALCGSMEKKLPKSNWRLGLPEAKKTMNMAVFGGGDCALIDRSNMCNHNEILWR